MYICVVLFLSVFLFTDSNQRTIVLQHPKKHSETEEPCKKVAREMKLYICKSMYCSGNFVNNCVEIK